jgi:D-alanyl-D-alanine carboxypeptidase
VGDDGRRGAELSIDVFDHFEHGDAGAVVERARGLITEQNLGLLGDGHPLLLTARLLAWLGDGQIPTAKLRIENGSGLFDANRLTTDGIALTLARMEARPEVFAEFLSQLSIYGTDGTLRNRHKDHESRSRVRAKTGTLRDTDALSGYVLRPSGKRPLVFSLIVTGARGGHGEVRAELDQTVFAWLEALAGS